MTLHSDISKETLRKQIANGEITLAGNIKLKIYGTLTCGSGKRMLNRNRVFFIDENEARALGFRPCGHCMSKAYQAWSSYNC